MILLGIALVPFTAKAGTKKPTMPSTQTVYYTTDWPGKDGYSDLEDISSFIYIKNLSSNTKITNIKTSSNGYSAADARKDYNVNALLMWIPHTFNHVVKNNSKCTVSCKVTQGGKTYSLKYRVTFKKMPTPFSTFRIGSKSYRNSFANRRDLQWKAMNKSAVLTVKPASRYRIRRITLMYEDGRTMTVKSGRKVDFRGLVMLTIEYQRTAKPKYYSVWKKGRKISNPNPLYG